MADQIPAARGLNLGINCPSPTEGFQGVCVTRQGAPMGVQPPCLGTMKMQGSRDLTCWQVWRWEGAVRADLGAQGSSAHSRMAPSQPPQRPLPQHPCFGLGKGLVFIPNSRDLSSRQARGYLRLLSRSSDPHVSLKEIKKSSKSE